MFFTVSPIKFVFTKYIVTSRLNCFDCDGWKPRTKYISNLAKYCSGAVFKSKWGGKFSWKMHLMQVNCAPEASEGYSILNVHLRRVKDTTQVTLCFFFKMLSWVNISHTWNSINPLTTELYNFPGHPGITPTCFSSCRTCSSTPSSRKASRTLDITSSTTVLYKRGCKRKEQCQNCTGHVLEY